MELNQLWSRSLRIIEIDAADGTLGSTLHAAGYHNYLAITRDDRRREVIARWNPAIAGCIVTSNSRRVIRQNNVSYTHLRAHETV